MRPGFFPESRLVSSRPATNVPQCGRCGLYKQCKSPKMEPSGDGAKRILIVAEAPGADEDRRNTQLVGKSGKELRKELYRLDIDLDVDCRKTNALICRPPDNAEPTAVQIESCRPNLVKEIQEYKPQVIIPLGGSAVTAVMALAWKTKQDIGRIGRWIGWRIPCQEFNAWIAPTFHPAFILREDERRNVVARLWWRRHLRAAVRLAGSRPWKELPDYPGRVEIITSPRDAALWLDHARKRGGTIALDYETTALKPETKGAKIVSAAVCWNGKRTAAFPFTGPAVEALGALLQCPRSKKIAANYKFEQRWTRMHYGFGVRGWVWDTMQAAHVLDSRKGITSVKFQSFVLLGQPDYEGRVAPFLDSGPNETNTVRAGVDLADLLLYNGMDAVLEFDIAIRQAMAFGITPDWIPAWHAAA